MVKMLRTRVPVARHAVRTVTTATERTRGSAWMVIRTRVMYRDCGLCQVCDKAGRLRLASEVDHIVPLKQGGTDDDANLQAICGECHKAKTAAEQGAHQRG